MANWKLSNVKLEKLLNKIQTMGGLGIWELDLSTSQSWWSEYMFTLFDRDPNLGPLSPQDALAYVHKDDLPALLEKRQNAIATESNYEHQFRIVMLNGSVKHLSNFAEFERDSETKNLKMFGTLQDITKKVSHDQLINDHQLKMVASSNLAASSEMAGAISHEINNPLAIIFGKIDTLKRSCKPGQFDIDTFQKDISVLEKNAQRINIVVKALRKLTDRGGLKSTESNTLKEAVAVALNLCSDRINSSNIKFECIVPEDIKVHASPSDLAFVILSLLNNAYDAIQDDLEKWIKLEAVIETNNEVHLSVTDSGLGIPKSILGKIMLPFFTTKSVGKGTGLGLSVSKRIIEEIGGSLSVDDKCSHTKFLIRLPLAGEQEILPLSVDEAIDAHLNWRQKLTEYFVNPNHTLDPIKIKRDDCCSLGKWIYTQNSSNQNNYILLKLKETHRHFHLCAGKLVERAHAGEKLVGSVVLGSGTEYDMLSASVINLLEELKNNLSKEAS